MDVKHVCSFFLIALVSCSSCHAQQRHDFRPVVKITKDDGTSGTGFIVAKDAGLCEVWTNAHVSGSTGEEVNVRFFNGETVTGKVAWSKLDRSCCFDAAKIIVSCPNSFVVDPVVIGNSSRTHSLGSVDGWPLGRWQVSKPIRKDKKSVSFGTAYQPVSHGGESGSPVTESDEGKVIGVCTWNLGPSKRPTCSVFQPIEHWTGESHSVELSFNKNLRPIGRHGDK